MNGDIKEGVFRITKSLMLAGAGVYLACYPLWRADSLGEGHAALNHASRYIRENGYSDPISTLITVKDNLESINPDYRLEATNALIRELSNNLDEIREFGDELPGFLLRPYIDKLGEEVNSLGGDNWGWFFLMGGFMLAAAGGNTISAKRQIARGLEETRKSKPLE